MAAVGVGFAKDLNTIGLEEAFIDSVGTCGPSSNVAGSLGKSEDPQVKIELRNALITEAADDAAVSRAQTNRTPIALRGSFGARIY